MNIDTISIDSMPTKTKLQVIQDIMDHPDAIQKLPKTTQNFLQQIIQSVATNPDALAMLPKKTQLGVHDFAIPKKPKKPAKQKKRKKRKTAKRKKPLTTEQLSRIHKIAWKRYAAENNIVFTPKPKPELISIRIHQKTVDILTEAKAMSKCTTWSTALEKIATTLGKSKAIDRSPIAISLNHPSRFLRIHKSVLNHLKELDLGEDNDETIYVAAREYIKLKS